MDNPNACVDLDFTGIFNVRTLKRAPPPEPLPEEILIGASAMKSGGYYVHLTRSAPPAAPRTGARTVLVVEDDPSTSLLLDRVLKRAGYLSRRAESGAGFVAAMKLAPIPDLILLDLELPDVSGFKILAKIREHPLTGKLPVIILSARCEPRDVFEGFTLGADGYVSKPTKGPALLQAVAAVLGAGPN